MTRHTSSTPAPVGTRTGLTPLKEAASTSNVNIHTAHMIHTAHNTSSAAMCLRDCTPYVMVVCKGVFCLPETKAETCRHGHRLGSDLNL